MSMFPPENNKSFSYHMQNNDPITTWDAGGEAAVVEVAEVIAVVVVVVEGVEGES